MIRNSILLEKALASAIEVFNITRAVQQIYKEFDITRQIIRSSGSICANVAEGQAWQSRRDFLAKFYIARKEYHETLIWLEYLYRAKLISIDMYQKQIHDYTEIGKMITSSIVTARKNNR